MQLSLIQPLHNNQLKQLILNVLAEHGAVGSGFAGADPEMNNLYKAYQAKGAAYWVLLEGAEVLGGGGIAQLKGASDDWCELQKVYFLPRARGKGMGKNLINKAIDFAKQHYRYCYLETLQNMNPAQGLYQSVGFTKLPAPLGLTGHAGCDVWMKKDLV